jgi:hypothetical protein
LEFKNRCFASRADWIFCADDVAGRAPQAGRLNHQELTTWRFAGR